MSVVPKVLPEVLRYLRERAIVKSSQLPESMKVKLLSQLDARLLELEAEVSGAVQAPQGPLAGPLVPKR